MPDALPASTIPAPPEDTCCICSAPAEYELRHDALVCSRACEEVWSSQFCASCGCCEAEGEMHSQLCDEAFNADVWGDLEEAS